MVLWFGKKQKKYLGIDIGTSSIKIVELKKEEERYKLKNYAIFYLGKFSSFGYQQKEASNLAKRIELINKALKEAKIDTKNVRFSVPIYSTFSTLINFPADMSKKEISSAVNYEAKKYVPVSLSEVVIDWRLVPAIKEGDSQKVLLVVVPKDVLKDYENIVKKTGLKMNIIEGESFSLKRALVGNDKTSIILLDWGARSLNATIANKGHIQAVYNLEKGGIKITRAIANRLNISLDEAEKKKIALSDNSLAMDEKDAVQKAVKQELENIFSEIKKIMDSYQQQNGVEIEKCILSGGGANLEGLADQLAANLNLDVSLADPFARINYDSEIKPAIKQLGPALAIASGLAVKNQ